MMIHELGGETFTGIEIIHRRTLLQVLLYIFYHCRYFMRNNNTPSGILVPIFLWMRKIKCWALLQIGPQVCKLRTQGFNLRIFVKKIEIYRKSAKQWYSWDVSWLFPKKKAILRFYVSTQLGRCIYNVQQPLVKFHSCGTIIFQRCFLLTAKRFLLFLELLFLLFLQLAILTAKRANLTSKNFQRFVFSKGKFRLFEVARGCTRQIWWHA